jgi:hypothetical protein
MEPTNTQFVENDVILETATNEDLSLLAEINKVEPVGLVLDMEDKYLFKRVPLKIFLVQLLIRKTLFPNFWEVKELMADFTLEKFFLSPNNSRFYSLLETTPAQKPFQKTLFMNVPR